VKQKDLPVSLGVLPPAFQSWIIDAKLIHNIENGALFAFCRDGSHKGPYGMDSTPLPPDYFTDILFGNVQFEYRGLIAANGSDPNVFGSVNQR
jgi:hypothetical protein